MDKKGIYNRPLNIRPNSEKILKITGTGKGIQGNLNSCYLDTALMAMFPFTCVFDYLLYREKNDNDIIEYNEIQDILKNNIVKQLRRYF